MLDPSTERMCPGELGYASSTNRLAVQVTIAFGPAKVHRVIKVGFQLKPSNARAAVIGPVQAARLHGFGVCL